MDRELATQPNTELHFFTFRAMNTDIEAALAVTPEDSFDALQADIVDWFQFAEEKFSRFRPDSELSRLNRLAGSGPVFISDSMLEVLALSESYRVVTDGIFNPLIARSLRLQGYDTCYDEVRRREHPFIVIGTPEPVSDCPISLDTRMKSVRLPSGQELDLGGIVKSWTVKRAAAWLRDRRGVRSGMINAGGDLTIWCDAAGLRKGPLWRIGVQNPFAEASDIGHVELAEGSAATSSRLGRSWLTDRGTKHHFIHPATMDSAVSDIVQASVFGPDPVECEIWSKTLCILGSTSGYPLFQERAPGYQVIFVKESGAVGGSPGLPLSLG